MPAPAAAGEPDDRETGAAGDDRRKRDAAPALREHERRHRGEHDRRRVDGEVRDGLKNKTPLHPELKVTPLEDAETDVSNVIDPSTKRTQVWPEFVAAPDTEVDVMGVGLFKKLRRR